jgi:hypothetical protein
MTVENMNKKDKMLINMEIIINFKIKMLNINNNMLNNNNLLNNNNIHKCKLEFHMDNKCLKKMDNWVIINNNKYLP